MGNVVNVAPQDLPPSDVLAQVLELSRRSARLTHLKFFDNGAKPHLWLKGPGAERAALKKHFLMMGALIADHLGTWTDPTMLNSECSTLWVEDPRKILTPTGLLQHLAGGTFPMNFKYGPKWQM